MRHRDGFDTMTETTKVAVTVLRDVGVQFMLGGSMAVWARGGPQPDNDLDLMVKPDHARAALEALAAAGMRIELPPEEWLYKAWHGAVLIDLIFRPTGLELTDEVFERAEVISVMAVGMPVMALDDVLVTMLGALDEHTLDYGRLLAITRAVREQIGWDRLRSYAGGSPYAKAFLTLVEELGIAPRPACPPANGQSRAHDQASRRVRVLGAAE